MYVAWLPLASDAVGRQTAQGNRQLCHVKREPPTSLSAASGMMGKRSGKSAKKLPASYSKADAVGGSKYEVSHIVGKGAYGVVWCVTFASATPPCVTMGMPGARPHH